MQQVLVLIYLTIYILLIISMAAVPEIQPQKNATTFWYWINPMIVSGSSL